MKMLINISLCLLALVAWGCSKKKPTQPPLDKTVIKGVVMDSLSGQPLPGTVVRLSTGLEAATGSDG